MGNGHGAWGMGYENWGVQELGVFKSIQLYFYLSLSPCHATLLNSARNGYPNSLSSMSNSANSQPFIHHHILGLLVQASEV